MAALQVLVIAGAQAASSAERERLLLERRAIEARYAAEERECADRFAVTACVEDVRARRRSALAGVRTQELELDDAERKRRAAERLQAIERRRLEAEARPAAASAPPAVVRQPRAAAPPAAARASANHTRSEEEAAARRAAASERRREAADAEAAKIREREAERERSGRKRAAPLPLPDEVKP